MTKNITNDVAKEVAKSRVAFMSKYRDVEKIVADISAIRACAEEHEKKIKELREKVEKLRVEFSPAIAEYDAEMMRVEDEMRKRGEVVQANKDRARIFAEDHQRWEINLQNARVINQVEKVKKLESSEPRKPDDIEVPTVIPIDKKIEASGLRMVQDLAVAMSDYAIEVLKRRECQAREAELVEALDNAECELIDTRIAFDQDVNRVVMERRRMAAVAAKEREAKIKALKVRRDSADAELKKMGV